MKKMVIKCKLCGVQYRKELNVSFHIFPKDPVLRKRWIEACKLHLFANRHPDQLSELRVCSKHFDADSYVPYNSTGIPRLKPDAVPKLGKVNKKKQHIMEAQPIYVSGQNIKVIPEPSVNNKSSHNIKYLNVIGQISTNKERDKLDLCDKNTEQCMPIVMDKIVISQVKDELDLYDENAEQCIPVVMNEIVISEEKDQLDLCDKNAEQCIPIMNEIFITKEEDKLDFCDENTEQCTPIVMNEIVISEERDQLDLCDENAEQFTPIKDEVVISEEKVELNLYNENTEQYIVEEITNDVDIAEDAPVIKRRKIWRPANVVQLTEEHFETPKDRELHLSLIKRKFEEQKKTIKSIQRQKNRLHKKIAVFSDVLHKLKDKKLIKEDVAKMLLMYYNTIFQIKSLKKH